MIFVNPTPNEELLNLLKEMEKKHKIGDKARIKFIQRSGVKTIDTLKVNDPFKANCFRKNCMACYDRHGQRKERYSICRKNNIGYCLQCCLCKSRGLLRAYEGESSRNLYLRGLEHLNDFNGNNKKSVMKKHVDSEHPEEKENVEFEMILTGTFRRPIERQIEERIRIKNHDEETILNSKSEYYGPCVVRRVAEGNSLECNICDFRCKSMFRMKDHKLTAHETERLFCFKCQQEFSNDNE